MSMLLRRAMMMASSLVKHIVSSVSGLVTFTTNVAASMPSVLCEFAPVQTGSGDPSPSNVRPISGWDKVSVFVTGKNLWNPDISTDGTAIDKLEYLGQYSGYAVYGFPVPANTQFRVHASVLASGNNAIFIQSKLSSADYGTAVSITNLAWAHDRLLTSDSSGYMYLLTNTTVPVTIEKVSEATVQIEIGNQAATGFEAYTGHSAPTSLGGTYYGGTLDVLTGVLTVTMAYIASYAGETINEPWLSSIDKYVSGTTPTTGAQVVYPLATPQTVQLTPAQIQSIIGTNNVWHNANGGITVEYYDNQ